jgi:hypothetical protein
MWAEAAVTANYIRNRSPTAARHKTTWELFFGKAPDVSNLRAFGSVVYAHTPDELRRKLDPLSQKGVFIGCEANSKAYRILLDNGKIVTSRDVIFDETATCKGPTPIQPIQRGEVGVGGQRRETWLHREEREDWKKRKRSSPQNSDTRQAPWTATLS